MTENVIPPGERLEGLLEEAGLRDFILTNIPLQPLRFRVDFLRPMTAEDVAIIVGTGVILSTSLGLEEETYTCRVTVPASWLPPESVAPDLTATAQEIKRLQSIIDEQRQHIARANTRAEAAEAARDDYLERLDTITEKYKAAQILLEGIVAPKSYEVRTLSQRIGNPEDREKADAELAAHLSQGWEKFDCTIIARELTFRYVTLTRECPAPQPERAPLVTVIPNTAVTIRPMSSRTVVPVGGFNG